MAFPDELRALTLELEALTDRWEEARAQRGTPDDVPIVARESDQEIQQLVADQQAYQERERQLWARYPQGGATPGALTQRRRKWPGLSQRLGSRWLRASLREPGEFGAGEADPFCPSVLAGAASPALVGCLEAVASARLRSPMPPCRRKLLRDFCSCR